MRTRKAVTLVSQSLTQASSEVRGHKSPVFGECTMTENIIIDKISISTNDRGNNGDFVVVPWKFDQEECRKALCRIVIIDELPFRFDEKEDFKQFMKVAQPCFHIPSRTTVTRDCFDLFDEEKRTLLSSDSEGVKRITKFLEIYLVHDMLHQIFIFLKFVKLVYLNQLISNEDQVLAKMTENMKEKFDKYWGDAEKMNKMIFIPCVLDPRHKFSTLGFALEKIFGEKKVAIENGVQTYMEALFSEYTNPISNDKSDQFSSTGMDTSISSSVGEFGIFFEELHKHKSEKGGASSKSELVKYLDEDTEIEKSDFDVLLWWKVNSPRFSFLSEMAQDVLAIPVSRRILDSFRCSLTPILVQALVCLQDWLRSEPQPISIEEDLDFLEQLEEDFIMHQSLVWNHYEKLEENEDASWKNYVKSNINK
uniref:HAT C-terminal dimerisation domain-containing protein n=1 Tax=Solanum lycopersicum TaxID=4081 RepID=A0A3Q7G0U9_SOLLC